MKLREKPYQPVEASDFDRAPRPANSRLGRIAVAMGMVATSLNCALGTPSQSINSLEHVSGTRIDQGVVTNPEKSQFVDCLGKLKGGNTCFYWVGAYQAGKFTTEGASANFSQPNPKIGPNFKSKILNHSLVEINVADIKINSEDVEIGEFKDAGDSSPVLFASAWVNGKDLGYAKPGRNGYVGIGNGFQVGDKLKVGETGYYGIKYLNGEWQIWYGNNSEDARELGYYPISLWANKGVIFTEGTKVDVYAEVATDPSALPRTWMGNGISGIRPGAASISDFSLYKATTPARLNNFYFPQGEAAEFYGQSGQNIHGFTYGGPGFKVGDGAASTPSFTVSNTGQ